MFGRKIPLFKLFGFQVNIDASWFILAILIIWILAEGFFPMVYEGFTTGTYWLMGVGGAIGLFFSIVFHEFSHSLVANRYGLPMKGITLFIFGGVAEMDNEPKNAKSEFLMAIAGPASSVLLGFILLGIWALGSNVGWPLPVNAVLHYLMFLNFILAVFNMVPAFPLDGGRVLRSILWGIKKDLPWATRVASKLGSAFGMFLIVMAILNLFYGNIVGAIWWFLIGMFIRGASKMSYRQVIIGSALKGEPVEKFMNPQPVTVPADTRLDKLVEDYFYHYHYKMFPVVNDDHLVGCITSAQVKQVPKSEWSNYPTRELAKDCSKENSVSPETDSMDALNQMNSTQSSRLMVIDNNELVGIITLKDLLRFLATKLDFEGPSETRQLKESLESEIESNEQ